MAEKISKPLLAVSELWWTCSAAMREKHFSFITLIHARQNWLELQSSIWMNRLSLIIFWQFSKTKTIIVLRENIKNGIRPKNLDAIIIQQK